MRRRAAVRGLTALLLLLGAVVVVPTAVASAETVDVSVPDMPSCRTSGYDHSCTFHPQPDAPPEDQLRQWVVPSGVTEVAFEVRGGKGGEGEQGDGGQGGRVRGSLAATPGQTFLIGVGSAADRSRPGLPDGGAPGTSERKASILAGGGGGSSVVGLSDETTLLVAGGGGGGGAGVGYFGFGGGHGGDAGSDGEKGFDLATEGGYGGFAAEQLEGGSTFRFFGGGWGGVGCPWGDDGGAGGPGDGGDGGAGGYGGGGGGGGAGGSGGGGSGRACSDADDGAPGVGGGGGGGSSYIASVISDGVTDLNPASGGAVTVRYTVAPGTADSAPPDTFLTSTPPVRDTRNSVERFNPRFGFQAVDDTSVVAYECRLDDGAFEPCASGHPVPVSAGDHTFAVRAVDGAGNADPTPASYAWTVPAGIAVQLSLHPDQPSPTNGYGLIGGGIEQYVQFRAYTDVEGLTFTYFGIHDDSCLVSMQVDGGPNDLEVFHDASAEEIAPGTWDVDLRVRTDALYGPHRLRLGEGCFVNAAGDPSLPSNEAAITLDKAPPETQVLVPPGPIEPGAPISIPFTGTDVHSAIASFECQLDGAAFEPCTSPAEYEELPAGSHTFRVRSIDAAGNVDPTPAAGTFLVDGPPVADAGADVSGDEGSPIDLTGSVSDPNPADVPTASWSVDAGAPCSFADPTAASTTITCNDDGTFTATLTADDGTWTDTDEVTVTVANAAPAVGAVTGPVDPLAVGTEAAVSAPFTDPGADDTHTCTIDWGDGSATVLDPATSACGGRHTYLAAGIYRVAVRVVDDDEGSDSESYQYVVVYDPSAGFVTGGGWIDSPPGAYTPEDPTDPDVTGRASFGFVSKYRKGATTPDGDTRFQFHAAGFDFTSTAYQWLVISGPKAQYKGTGTINGSGDFGFLLTARDGQQSGGGGVDRFRIKIWDLETGTTVYDNQAGAEDDAEAHGAIGAGNIVIHGAKR